MASRAIRKGQALVSVYIYLPVVTSCCQGASEQTGVSRWWVSGPPTRPSTCGATLKPHRTRGSFLENGCQADAVSSDKRPHQEKAGGRVPSVPVRCGLGVARGSCGDPAGSLHVGVPQAGTDVTPKLCAGPVPLLCKAVVRPLVCQRQGAQLCLETFP